MANGPRKGLPKKGMLKKGFGSKAGGGKAGGGNTMRPKAAFSKAAGAGKGNKRMGMKKNKPMGTPTPSRQKSAGLRTPGTMGSGALKR